MYSIIGQKPLAPENIDKVAADSENEHLFGKSKHDFHGRENII